jgi:hypothetical protein
MGTRELIAIVALVELGLHYFPWRMLIGKDLPRLAAYTLGLLGMMGPFSAWLIDRNEVEILQTLWIVIVSAGVMVFALYGFDHYLDLSARAFEAEERESMHREADGKKS